MQIESYEERKDTEWLNKQWEKSRRIKPLTGEVLVELLPHDRLTAGGIEIPERCLSPYEVESRHLNPDKPKPWFGVVREIGAWPKLKCGKLAMPEYGIGSRVILRHNSGTEIRYHERLKLRMVRQEDVLAVFQ